MNIAMTGATGYIGKQLSNYLTEKGGHRIIPLGRAMFREGMSGLLVQYADALRCHYKIWQALLSISAGRRNINKSFSIAG